METMAQKGLQSWAYAPFGKRHTAHAECLCACVQLPPATLVLVTRGNKTVGAGLLAVTATRQPIGIVLCSCRLCSTGDRTGVLLTG